jgi:hypothetical protein
MEAAKLLPLSIDENLRFSSQIMLKSGPESGPNMAKFDTKYRPG